MIYTRIVHKVQKELYQVVSSQCIVFYFEEHKKMNNWFCYVLKKSFLKLELGAVLLPSKWIKNNISQSFFAELFQSVSQ